MENVVTFNPGNTVQTIQSKLDTLPKAANDKLAQSLEISLQERLLYQTRKSEAFVMGRISLEIANWLYQTIGKRGSLKNGNWPAGVTLAEKFLAKQLMAQILGVR